MQMNLIEALKPLSLRKEWVKLSDHETYGGNYGLNDKWLHPNQFVSVVLTEVRQMIHVYAK